MLVNKYILENIRTGEKVIGTRAELELKGFDGDWLSDASKRKFLINKEWKCSLCGKVEKPTKQKEKRKKALSIDDVQKLAQEAGMNYGKYVALHNL